jgi:hemerythrin-like domain-containing protein
MPNKIVSTRRSFLAAGTFSGGAVLLAAIESSGADVPAPTAKTAEKPGKKPGAEPEEEISPVEDLMREHGALNRLLLIYEEISRRLRRSEPFDPKTLAAAAKIVKSFVEDYHEKLEEDFVFPRFEKAGKLVELVKTLRGQHEAGRRLTGRVQQAAAATGPLSEQDRRRLTSALQRFVRMYRPHEAREDTVLFPVFRSLVPEKEYDALGELFEKKENELFGHEGFERIVDQVAGLEKSLEIYDLEKFTPKR